MLAMASYPTYQPSIYVGRADPKKLAPLLDPTGGGRRRTTRASTARSTRRTRRARPSSRSPRSRRCRRGSCTRSTSCSARPTSRPTGRCSTTGRSADPPVHRPADGARDVVRHVLLRARPALLRRCLPTAATRCRAGRTASASASSPGIDIGPEVPGLCRRRSGGARRTRRARATASIDRTWKPGYSIQLAIGQGQLLVTPLQMTRLYAMIANGGNLVTPHLADDVELTGAERPARARPAPLRRPAGGADAASTRPRCATCSRGSTRRRTRRSAPASGVFGNFPVDIAGKTGSAEKNVTLPGVSVPAEPDPVVVVRVRARTTRRRSRCAP